MYLFLNSLWLIYMYKSKTTQINKSIYRVLISSFFNIELSSITLSHALIIWGRTSLWFRRSWTISPCRAPASKCNKCSNHRCNNKCLCNSPSSNSSKCPCSRCNNQSDKVQLILSCREWQRQCSSRWMCNSRWWIMANLIGIFFRMQWVASDSIQTEWWTLRTMGSMRIICLKCRCRRLAQLVRVKGCRTSWKSLGKIQWLSSRWLMVTIINCQISQWICPVQSMVNHASWCVSLARPKSVTTALCSAITKVMTSKNMMKQWKRL